VRPQSQTDKVRRTAQGRVLLRCCSLSRQRLLTTARQVDPTRAPRACRRGRNVVDMSASGAATSVLGPEPRPESRVLRCSAPFYYVGAVSQRHSGRTQPAQRGRRRVCHRRVRQDTMFDTGRRVSSHERPLKTVTASGSQVIPSPICGRRSAGWHPTICTPENLPCVAIYCLTVAGSSAATRRATVPSVLVGGRRGTCVKDNTADNRGIPN